MVGTSVSKGSPLNFPSVEILTNPWRAALRCIHHPMQLTGNTVLVTGGGSGIGRGLAESLFKLGNQVIIAGRRQDFLDNTTKANPGIVSLNLDVSDPEAIQDFAARVTKEHPNLNVLINNAGIMKPENLQALPAGLADSEAVITTNLLGPIRLTAALLPHLRKQTHAAIINVSSGLAFVLSRSPRLIVLPKQPCIRTRFLSGYSWLIHRWRSSKLSRQRWQPI